jgi:hypothetical protein
MGVAAANPAAEELNATASGASGSALYALCAAAPVAAAIKDAHVSQKWGQIGRSLIALQMDDRAAHGLRPS